MNDTPDRAPSRRRGLPSASIRRPIGLAMLWSVVLVFGWFFVSGLPLDLLPPITYPNIRVGVNYANVEPEVLEEQVAKPLESALATTEGVTRIETEVQEGRVGINLEFDYGTDLDVALQDAAQNLERARRSLPPDVDPPTIRKYDPSQSPVYEVAFSSGVRDPISLRDWVEQRLEPQLLTVEGVAAVDISGGLEREVRIVLDPQRLRSYGLSVTQVNNALRTANQDVAAGLISSPSREIVGVTQGRFRTVDEIRNLVLPLPGGGRVPLSEVATVADTSREQRLWARLNGVPAVKLSVRKQPDANTVAVADGVNERLHSLAASRFVPDDIDYRVIDSQAEFIRNAVSSVRDAALTGAGLAMLIVFLFLGSIRKTVVIGLGIPIAVLATFIMMGMGGLTLNIMSLGGLALGVGLLIDNSIVMLENIFRHMEENHEDSEAAAHEGAGEIQSAVIASTATNLAAVVPFLLITGLTALIFRELILTISFAILASLTVALTLVPMLAAQLSKVAFSSGLNRSRPIRAVDGVIGRLRAGYRRVTPGLLRWRGAVLGGAIAVLVAVVPLTQGLGNEFLPQVDSGNIGVFLRLEPGSPPEETNRIALELEQMAGEMPHVRDVFTTAGGFLFGGSTAERGGFGSMTIVLDPVGQRDMSADEWVRRFEQRIEDRGFAGAQAFVRPPRIRGLRTSNSGSDATVIVQGDDLIELQRIGEEIVTRLEGIPGLRNPEASADDPSPQLAIRLDRERASYYGLNTADVGQTIRTALDGTIPTRYTEGNREYDVRVMFPDAGVTSPEDLAGVPLFPVGGSAPIRLGDVAEIGSALGPSNILRENQNRILRVTGDVLTDVASVGEVSDEIRARLTDLQLPAGYGVIVGGEDETIQETNRQALIVTLLAIFLVFVVLAVQYESLINPLVILTAIPLSLIGVGVALWLTGTPLSAPVLLGVILLAGIVVNNAILLVEYIEEYRKQPGSSLSQATVDAGAVRLRPILMTTLTTSLGMLPLALGIGEGSELMQPLAIAMIGGLSLSMLLTLFVVPCAYLIFNQAGDRVKTWLTVRDSGGTGRGVGAAPVAEPAAGD